MAKGGKVKALTEAVNALERELVKTKTQLEIIEGTLSDDGKRVGAAKTAVQEVSRRVPDPHSTPDIPSSMSRFRRNEDPRRKKPQLLQSSNPHTMQVWRSSPKRKNCCKP